MALYLELSGNETIFSMESGTYAFFCDIHKSVCSSLLARGIWVYFLSFVLFLIYDVLL